MHLKPEDIIAGIAILEKVAGAALKTLESAIDDDTAP
jgi:hypothetical protein